MKKIFSLVISVLLCTTILCACNLADIKSVQFKKYSDAQEYINKGWIPSNLPTDATEIFLVYNIDTNEINGKFKTTQTEVEKIKGALNSATKDEFETSDKALNEDFSKMKEELNEQINFEYYSDDSFVYAFTGGNSVVFFGR